MHHSMVIEMNPVSLAIQSCSFMKVWHACRSGFGMNALPRSLKAMLLPVPNIFISGSLCFCKKALKRVLVFGVFSLRQGKTLH